MTFIPTQNLNASFAHIDISAQVFPINESEPRILLENRVGGDGIISLSVDSRSFILAAGYSYFMTANLGGILNLPFQVVCDFYNETTGQFFQQGGARVIDQEYWAGWTSISMNAMALEVTTQTTVSIQYVPGYWVAPYANTWTRWTPSTSKTRSAITIVYKAN